MRSVSYLIFIVVLLMGTSLAVWSQSITPYTQAELDELFAPIALYPDPLLAQILPASTFPDQLQAASDFLQFQGASGMIDDQAWDVSVKAVAHYPSVLKMMVDSPDWTTAIGQAYVNQPDDVMKSIQRLRGKARLLGYLSSNSQQRVVVSNGYISIVPAQPQYIYVPTYNPQVVYVTRRPSYGNIGIAFGVGLLIGAWLNRDVNWNQHRVYYHGWRGGGWIGRSRPRVRINNQYYVNNTFRNRPIPVNRGIRSRDITNYRQQVKRGAGTYRVPGLVRPALPAARPSAPVGRPSRPLVPSARPVPRPLPVPGPTMPKPKPGITKPYSRTRPGTPSTRTPRPSTGITKPYPSARPGTPTVRPVPKPSSGVTRPYPGTKQGKPSVRPTSKPSGATRQSPAVKQKGQKGRAQPKSEGSKKEQREEERK